MFFKGSRYEQVAERTGKDRHGRTVRYKAIREIPTTPARLGHEVGADERLDQIASTYYGDPLRFWRIADANLAVWPDDLLEIHVVLAIPPARGRSDP